MWASQQEKDAHLDATTFATHDYRIVESWDNGEFLTFAKLVLYVKGQAVEATEFSGSSEEPGPDALAQAYSYAQAWLESVTYPLEERLGPYGLEWQREQEERYA